MTERIYLLPLWLRLWHWANALLILTLMATGFSLHFATPGKEIIEFAWAVRVHNIAGLALVALYFFFVVANAFSGNWWQYVPKPPGILNRCWLQARYYAWGIFKGESEPFPITREVNFNALQSISYWIVMYVILPALIVTGLIYLDPESVPPALFGFDGHLIVAMLHYLIAVIVVLFLIVHVYICTMGAKVTSTFKTMITGWHEHE